MSKKVFDKLVDGGASSPATAKRIASNLGFEPMRSAKPTWISFGNPTFPLQFLLEIKDFRPQKLQRSDFSSGK